MPARFGRTDPVRFFRDWTDGCISASNRAIEILWRNVGLFTPITIKA